MWVAFVVVMVAAIAAAWFLDEPLLRFLLRHGHNDVRRTVAWVIALQVVWYPVMGLLWLAPAGDLVSIVSFVAAFGQLLAAWLFVPMQTGYRVHREQFEAVGARPEVARAAYWVGGPFAVAGVAAALLSPGFVIG